MRFGRGGRRSAPHPDLQPTAGPVRSEANPGPDLHRLRILGAWTGRVQPGRAPHRSAPDQHEALPVAGQPAPAGAEPAEPARADLAPEASPVVGIPVLPRRCGYLRIAD